MTTNVLPIVVIGGGAAGSMAALRAGLNNDEVHLFTGSAKNKKKSRAQWVAKVENVPGLSGYKRGVSDPHREALDEFKESDLGHNLHIHKGVGITLIKKLDDNLFELTDSKDEKHLAKYVIVATGVMDVQPEIDGDMKNIFPYANVQLVDYCIRCDGHRSYGKETAIIGEGNGAAWGAVMLKERYEVPNMTILTNGKEATWGSDVQELLELYQIDVIADPIQSLIGNPREDLLEGAVLMSGERVPFDFAFVSLGMLVYNELVKDLGVEVDERGFVVTNKSGESSISNLYVAGDLRANTKKQIYTAWDTAVDSADDINGKLRKEKRLELLKTKTKRRFSHV